MFVAKAKNWYADAGLQVSFLSPHTDEYKATPASRVESGEASFAVAPSESAISYHIRSASMPKPALKAVGALLQSDDSAIATLKSSGIDRPAKLEGKRYASYAARFEGRIVQEMIRADGGGGDYTELALPMLGVWNTLLSGEADATWIFQGWEGVQASMAGVELNTFKLEDYGIAYGYSPVLLAAPQTLSERGDAVKAFLGATTRGYQWAAANPAEAAQVLVDAAKSEFPDLDRLNLELVKRSVEVVAKVW